MNWWQGMLDALVWSRCAGSGCKTSSTALSLVENTVRAFHHHLSLMFCNTSSDLASLIDRFDALSICL